MLRYLTILVFIIASFFSITYSCDVAVVSSIAAKDGKPIIWKNRDDPAGVFFGVRRHEANNPEVGSYICIEERLYPDLTTICSAGVNEAGFAIANTNAYTGSLVKELVSIDVPLMEKALSNCKTVECFETLLINAHNHEDKFYVTSSNFVVIDAYGGAVHYEAYADMREPVEFIKHDANIVNFSNKTNHIDLHEIYDSTSEKRTKRGAELLTEYYNKDELTPKTMMQIVAKDVCNDEDNEQDLENFDTTFCISRAYTRFSTVIEGVTPNEDPKYTTMWVNVGEPSAGVYVPIYPAAHYIPEAVNANLMGGAPLNVEIINKELELYENNGGVFRYLEVLPSIRDMTINKIKLYDLQDSLTFPLEDTLIEADREIKQAIKNGEVNYDTEEVLKTFSKDASNYAYDVYSGKSELPSRSNLYTFQMWLRLVFNNSTSLIDTILGR
ncbi:MAG: hypothetical protein SVN78_03170 [Deferribacterota bacterium]|nr:hypothetical protein [Deferribacterota bacterium]